MLNLAKTIFTTLLLSVCVGYIAGCSKPEPTLHDEQGNSIKLSELKGKWVFINYWAPWCSDCQYEIPELNKFVQDNKNNKKVALLGFDYDQAPTKDLKSIVQSADIKFPVLAENPAELFQLDYVEFIPTTFVINPEGKIVKKIVGHTDAETLEAFARSVG